MGTADILEADFITAVPFNSTETETAPNIAPDFTTLIGNTPLVYINKLAEGLNARIAAKLEYLSPGGSVKDRIALNMVDAAEREGAISRGRSVLVEATSGNTGVGVAALAAARGFRTVLVMPDSASVERRLLLLQLGARIVLTDHKKGVAGVFEKLEEVMQKTPDAYSLNQFENPVNVATHERTTGPEIWRDTAGKVDIFVAGVGTSGTIGGVGKYLKSQNPNVKIIAVEPAESAVLSGGPPGPHKIQGTGAGIIPPLYKRDVIDEVFAVKSDDAIETAKQMALQEGLIVGISSGAAVKASLEIAKREENKGKLIVTLLPSLGERYLSTELFAEARKEADMLQVEDEYTHVPF